MYCLYACVAAKVLIVPVAHCTGANGNAFNLSWQNGLTKVEQISLHYSMKNVIEDKPNIDEKSS